MTITKTPRESIKKTQEEVCEIIHITQSTLSKIENRNHNNALVKYLTYLVDQGIDINTLFKRN